MTTLTGLEDWLKCSSEQKCTTETLYIHRCSRVLTNKYLIYYFSIYIYTQTLTTLNLLNLVHLQSMSSHLYQ